MKRTCVGIIWALAFACCADNAAEVIGDATEVKQSAVIPANPWWTGTQGMYVRDDVPLSTHWVSRVYGQTNIKAVTGANGLRLIQFAGIGSVDGSDPFNTSEPEVGYIATRQFGGTVLQLFKRCSPNAPEFLVPDGQLMVNDNVLFQVKWVIAGLIANARILNVTRGWELNSDFACSGFSQVGMSTGQFVIEKDYGVQMAGFDSRTAFNMVVEERPFSGGASTFVGPNKSLDMVSASDGHVMVGLADWNPANGGTGSFTFVAQ